MNATILTHYDKADPGFTGDYLEVAVIIDGQEVRHYGDFYHDRGAQKAKAFCDGVEYVCQQADVQFALNREDAADIEVE
jgi:hypothetical protein